MANTHLERLYHRAKLHDYLFVRACVQPLGPGEIRPYSRSMRRVLTEEQGPQVAPLVGTKPWKCPFCGEHVEPTVPEGTSA